MQVRKISKLALDVAMVVILAVTMASRVTGTKPHIGLGIMLLVLFVTHSAINRYWYKTCLKGRYNYIRWFNGVINVLLIAAVFTTALSGILLSPAFGLGQTIRQIHALAAHWLLILAGMHLGRHWAAILRSAGLTQKGPALKIVLRLLALLIVIGGVRASCAKDVGAKLIMYFSFSFWNPDEPVLLYILDYVLVMALWACVAHYALQLIKRLKAVPK